MVIGIESHQPVSQPRAPPKYSETHRVEKAACAYVLGFGAQMEVIEPLEFRDRVLQAAKETSARYNGSVLDIGDPCI